VNARAAQKPYRLDADGLLLRVRLTPKSSRDAVDGLREDGDKTVLLARVRAAPEKGRANAALEKLVGKWLGVAKSNVGVVSGHTSRMKTVRIAGDPAATAAAIEEQLSELD
jgi:uncharacterized protein (TIGR00251 family)